MTRPLLIGAAFLFALASPARAELVDPTAPTLGPARAKKTAPTSKRKDGKERVKGKARPTRAAPPIVLSGPAPKVAWSAPPPSPESPSLTWTLVHECRRPGHIEARLFGPERNVRWPAGQLVYHLQPGRSRTVTLACRIGEKICFGAQQAGSNISWGFGLFGRSACETCCRFCGGAAGYNRLRCDR